MYELVIVFYLMTGGAAMERHSAGPYATFEECESARVKFVASWPVVVGVAQSVTAACLHLPEPKK